MINSPHYMHFQLIDKVHMGTIMFRKESLFKNYYNTSNKSRSNSVSTELWEANVYLGFPSNGDVKEVHSSAQSLQNITS